MYVLTFLKMKSRPMVLDQTLTLINALHNLVLTCYIAFALWPS